MMVATRVDGDERHMLREDTKRRMLRYAARAKASLMMTYCRRADDADTMIMITPCAAMSDYCCAIPCSVVIADVAIIQITLRYVILR